MAPSHWTVTRSNHCRAALDFSLAFRFIVIFTFLLITFSVLGRRPFCCFIGRFVFSFNRHHVWFMAHFRRDQTLCLSFHSLPHISSLKSGPMGSTMTATLYEAGVPLGCSGLACKLRKRGLYRSTHRNINHLNMSLTTGYSTAKLSCGAKNTDSGKLISSLLMHSIWLF